ncbi:MAG: hypothetical protein ACJ79A_15830 [Gemmatimonadaceae bacterium]
MARRLVPGQFVVVVALLSLWVLFEKFLGAQSGLAFAVLGMPLLALSTLAVMVWTAWGIRWRKVAVLLLVVVADAGFISGSSTLSRAGDRMFFETRRSRLDTFARDIVAYGRIHEMSDGMRSFIELNGDVVAGSTSDGPARSLVAPAVPLEQVLTRDGIAAQRYEEFRDRLRDLKIIQFDAEPGFVAFLYDGMLENLEGYLLVKPGGSPPAMRSTLFGAALIHLEPLGDGWYRFATT